MLKSSAYESWIIIGPYYSCFLFNGLLFGLQALTLMWSWTIGYMVYQKVLAGEVKFDLLLWSPEGGGIAENGVKGSKCTCTYFRFGRDSKRDLPCIETQLNGQNLNSYNPNLDVNRSELVYIVQVVVPTSTGNPRKIGEHFPVMDRFGNFEHTGKVKKFLDNFNFFM